MARTDEQAAPALTREAVLEQIRAGIDGLVDAERARLLGMLGPPDQDISQEEDLAVWALAEIRGARRLLENVAADSAMLQQAVNAFTSSGIGGRLLGAVGGRRKKGEENGASN